jgi:two-component system LytT family sensor kinase
MPRLRTRPTTVWVSALWIVPAVLGAINEIAQRRLWGGPPIQVRELLFASGDWLLYGFLTPAVFGIARRWPIGRPHLWRRAVSHAGMSLLFCVAWAVSGTLLRAVLFGYPKEGMLLPFVSWLFVTFPFGVAVYFAVVGTEHAIRYFVEARDRDLQLAQVSEQLTAARFAALQAQLNPHFLFNTLNTIAVFVRDGDRAGAARMIEQLAEVLRRTLNRGQFNEIALKEEIELVRHYLAIEQARFPDRLVAVLDLDSSLSSAAVPSFAVQHLVENAVRHGVAKSAHGGRIEVSARRDGDALVVAVTDDGPGFDLAAGPPEGHGIANTRDRLRALFGARAQVTVEQQPAGGTRATLRVPYHEPSVDTDDGQR